MNLRSLKTLVLLLFTVPGMIISGQDINKTGKDGKKQGKWINKYPNGNILYEGQFINDLPSGEFKRYYETGVLKSVVVFHNNGTEASATLYYPNGLPASAGKYVNRLKEGKWRFLSSSSKDVLICETEYAGDKKNGLMVTYYPDGSIAEKAYYKDDRKHGDYLKYYSNGTLTLRTSYTNGMLNGMFEAFYENGKAEIIGQYKNNIREGQWIMYDKEGNPRFNTKYEAGIPDNRNMDIYESDLIDSLERNIGKIADPEKTGEIW
jgi:antitoxin component YwqK of YwqJK toxin-antitoxin module